MSFGYIAIGIGLVAGAAASAYSTSTQAGIADQQLQLAGSQNYRQATSFEQLQQLLNNPQSFFDSPVYKSAAAQGTQATQRAQAASGFLGSGNEAAALQQYGQTFGQQQLFNQESLLASMSGASFNPSGALGGASSAAGAAGSSLNSLAGLLSFFGNSGLGSIGAAAGGSTTIAGGIDAVG